MGRKNLLSGLLDDAAAPAPAPVVETPAPLPEARPSSTFGTKGAVGAMSRSLEKLSAENDAAKVMAEQLAHGSTVVEVDPALIDASFVPDRMPGTEADHVGLVQSIAESGQLVPVLLRPHPEQPSRYQTAFGHRRIRALTELKKPVRAIIKKLTDEELVVAQGKENGERLDLSFIERANYAMALEDRNFKRDVIGAALSVDKTELSRLISVGRAIPRELTNAIGPAPKTGRRRWLELEELMKGRSVVELSGLLTSEGFATSSSDDRFNAVCSALAPKVSKEKPAIWTADDGKKVASIAKQEGDRTTLALNEKVAPGFGDFVTRRLADLYAEYLKEGRGG